jgi:dienelactone hydrolase
VGCAPDTTGRVTTTVDIACADGVQAAPVDWYFPVGRPTAVLWLQHGFVESKDNWTELAPQAAARGLLVMATSLPTFDPSGCNVENLGDNAGYLDNIATMIAGIDDPSSALSASFARAAEHAGRDRATLPQRLVFAGHSAGGETVLSVADRLRTGHPATFAKLRGLVLEDPVNSFLGTNMKTALEGLDSTKVPIYELASPPGACNNGQSGTALVTSSLTTRSFHGAAVTTGTHGDVFGGAAGILVTAACGLPQPANVEAVQSLTLAWASDQAAGTRTRSWYPGGADYQALVTAGTISTLR